MMMDKVMEFFQICHSTCHQAVYKEHKCKAAEIKNSSRLTKRRMGQTKMCRCLTEKILKQ